jgi:hypothetical protein
MTEETDSFVEPSECLVIQENDFEQNIVFWGSDGEEILYLSPDGIKVRGVPTDDDKEIADAVRLVTKESFYKGESDDKSGAD